MSVSSVPLEKELREAQGDHLTKLVLEAPAAALEAVLDNPALDDEGLLLLLRRPDAGVDLLKKVASLPQWTSKYLVKAALVAHGHTPKTVALNFAKHLFWRDLAKLIANFRVSPPVRKMAEVLLRDRLHEMALGERVALARMAPGEVLRAMRAERHERVVAALLENPRLTEDDVVVMANDTKAPPAILARVGRTERWATRYHVKLALVRNPRTPFSTALALLTRLLDRDLDGVAATPAIPAGVRSAAARLVALRRAQKTAPRVRG